MPAKRYYIRDHLGNVTGPFSAETLKRLAAERKLDLSWQISTDRVNWCIVAKVRNLSVGLETALAVNLSTEKQYRDLSHQEVLALFLDKFVLNNDNFKGSFPLLPTLRKWWAKVTLPKDFVITEVTASGVHHVRYNMVSGEAREIDQREAEKNVTKGIQQFNWFLWFSALLGAAWLTWMVVDFATHFSPTWETLKTIVFVGIALSSFVYKTKRSKVFVGYNLDGMAIRRLEKIAEGVSILCRCGQVWIYRVQQNAGKLNWKYNAGDTFSVAKLPLAIFNRTIPNIETNIRVHGIAHRSQAIYFLPEHVLLVNGNDVSNIPYSNLEVDVDHLEYVEQEGHVYRDSNVVAHRWKYINRDGSKDKRFKDNVEMPVVRCGILGLSGGQIRLRMMTTNPDAPPLIQEKLNELRMNGTRSAVSTAPLVGNPPASAAAKRPRLEAIPVEPNPVRRMEKACSFCGEQILLVARKCKHCGEMLEKNTGD